MPLYQAYGLTIHSELPLPELVALSHPLENSSKDNKNNAQPDIFVHLEGQQHTSSPTQATPGKAKNSRYWVEGSEVCLFWPSLGTFRICNGNQITIAVHPHVDAVSLRPPILGACMAVALHQRGLLVLHASAIALPTGAIAFLGDKGWGKSTMAAALYAQGYPFITDDVLAIDLNDDELPIVYPAFPQMKLWPNAVSALGGDPDELPKIIPQIEKRQCLLDHDMSKHPVCLKSLYLLGKGTVPSLDRLPPRTILGHLFQHSYSGRFGKKLLQHGESSHFLQCMSLARSVPFYHLHRPSDLALLPEIVSMIIAHEPA